MRMRRVYGVQRAIVISTHRIPNGGAVAGRHRPRLGETLLRRFHAALRPGGRVAAPKRRARSSVSSALAPQLLAAAVCAGAIATVRRGTILDQRSDGSRRGSVPPFARAVAYLGTGNRGRALDELA